MQDLLKPDFGVMLLTICNFLLLVYLLKKFAWKSIIGALEKREQQIAADKQHAQQARVEAEKLKNELSAALNRVAEEASAKIAQAVKTGETQREQLLAAAKEQSARLLEQARAEICAEKEKALADVRNEIARTALLAAEKITRQEMSEASSQEAVSRVLSELKK
ncbi:MAG: F0F1 ATP synthase subunit B [Elusimicrobiaceae bacterium]|nr:F0F1 ATP synthase subunit B [Elusimicrobiaceae bacterium]